MPAVCGSNSQSSMPARPCLVNLNGEPSTLPLLLVEVRFQLAGGIRLAVVFVELGLGIEEVHLARPAVLEQADHALGPRANRGGSAAGSRLDIVGRGVFASRCASASEPSEPA